MRNAGPESMRRISIGGLEFWMQGASSAKASLGVLATGTSIHRYSRQCFITRKTQWELVFESRLVKTVMRNIGSLDAIEWQMVCFGCFGTTNWGLLIILNQTIVMDCKVFIGGLWIVQPDYVLDFTSWRKSRNEDAKLRIMENAGLDCWWPVLGAWRGDIDITVILNVQMGHFLEKLSWQLKRMKLIQTGRSYVWCSRHCTDWNWSS